MIIVIIFKSHASSILIFMYFNKIDYNGVQGPREIVQGLRCFALHVAKLSLASPGICTEHRANVYPKHYWKSLLRIEPG